ncbi:2-iminobutanoate/2-iminopropanoate deaminase [Pseudonocardia thermophila]|uniref:2-iminobutanoate/2-iminopropanoate deaminase n=1 Tax=Pseudonocardia thermophila TaxID=1848 RepID=A0A1M6UG87_PSETH|nr:RidA family protein [Pseudonocardia thermophila]SHK68189.1 2-iminobutanoate/2-iminopropanoate deaminase [Pseudonocardia thermophila]
MTRRSITVPGLEHGTSPIPTAAVVGPLLISGSISGVDRATGTVPPELPDQVANLFDNVRAVVEAAGGGLDDVVKLAFTVTDRAARAHIDPVWCATFPDPQRRPARHVAVYAHLPAGLLLQCEVTAYIGS